MMNIPEFDKMVEEFLGTLDDESKDEYWGTAHSIHSDALKSLRVHLFSDAIEKAERYEQYKKLKAEFE